MDAAQYHRVLLDGWFLNDKEAYVYSTGPDGAPVYHVLTPFETRDRRILMVDRGIVPPELRDPRKRKPVNERVMIGIGIRCRPAASYAGAGSQSPCLVFARREVHRGCRSCGAGDGHAGGSRCRARSRRLAEGRSTQVTFPNDHLQYAITWFGLAWALLIIYFLYHRSRGRLGWG